MTALPADVVVGHAPTDGRRTGGWFVGDLAGWLGGDAAAAAGRRDSTAVEVKWGAHAAGARRPAGWAPPAPVVTLSVLVAGTFTLTFRADEPGAADAVVRLERPGDYALWGPAAAHTWEAPTDAVILTVRWPAGDGGDDPPG